MDAQIHERQTVAERLAPIAQGLASRQFAPDDLQSAQTELRDVAAALDGVEPNDWAATATVLSDLVEIAACSMADMDGHENDRLVDCIVQGVSLLQEALSDPDASSEQLGVFLDQARDDWSDCLAVVDPHDADDLELSADNGSTDWGADVDQPPSSGEVQMILSTLGKTTTDDDNGTETDAEESAAANDDVPTHLFDSAMQESGEIVPPTGVPVVDDVELEPELHAAYLCDAEQCLESMEQAALELESGGGEAAIQQLCRALHTLKGASASVGFTNLGGYLHQLEEWLQQVGMPRNLDSVLSCIDVVRKWIAEQQQPTGQQPASYTPHSSDYATDGNVVQNTTSQLASVGAAAIDMDDSLRVKTSQVDRLMDQLANLVMLRSRRDLRAAQVGTIQEELLGCVARLQTAANASATFSTTVADAETNGTLDPSAVREGHLSEVAGDLTEVARSLKELHDPLVEENRTLSQFIRQFRHELMELRRMPVSGLFRRLQRVVRDAARVEEKQVRLEMVGEHAGLERSVQERLYEPLLHLVRNAVSHGIESDSDRIAAGKTDVGTITLEAFGSAQLLVLEIRDDGRGLDYEAIRGRGIQRGLISTDQETSRSQLAQLIFHPGFSTRERANAVAGRGVGMDVVASTLRRMHARVDVESEPGQGTTIRLRIPLRSVIEHTMVFRCGGQLFALPVQSVRAASKDELRGSHAESTDVETDTNPVRLGDVLGLPHGSNSQEGHCLVLGQTSLPQKSEGSSSSSTSDAQPTHRTITVLVDEILGPDEVVVRPLPPLLRRHSLLAGATLSGGGDVVQLLDSDRLVEACLESTHQSLHSSTPATSPTTESASTGVVKVLVVDDSMSARRSLIQILRPRGFELHEAADGFDALDRLRTEHFDMVFSDLEMPRMGGFDLLAEIRSNRKTRSLPVVIVTARGEAEYRARADELGSDGYLTKPVAAPDLENTLDQLKLSAHTDEPEGAKP
ncbi:MAG: response regulator [Planctomycetaceae bacterium]|jgi:chemosensory pili system protein ChpA (sensor histidine kinase/response regulator)|nr:response regulator [Planctomycetaceae bacterium]MBT6485094.1 response regulator [Planctomycetaceae bacterium]MBT6495907.1 response regulator [Planctomycetaceae bacterium]